MQVITNHYFKSVRYLFLSLDVQPTFSFTCVIYAHRRNQLLEKILMKALFLGLGMTAVLASGSAMADLELAKKSGCLACHSVEKKIVGPAWRDVGKKYKGDAEAKARLIAKVKAGGKGVWGAAPMPPYSPRVADADIEKLVTFVLSLGE
jgi:cytochrome c